jgi:AraC-like DNA-binding protein
MLTPHSPPDYALQLHSDDPDEVTSWAAQRDGDHSRVVHGSGPYGFRAATLGGQKVWLAWARAALGQTIRGRARHPFVQVPIDATQEYTFGRRRFAAPAGALVFVAPGTEMSRSSGPSSVFAIDVDGDALAAEVEGRSPGVRLDWPQFPRSLELPESQRRALSASVSGLIAALEPGVCATRRAQCESVVIATLADALTTSSRSHRAGRPTAQRLAHLESWIDAHLGETITIGRLCEVAGTGERALQIAFMSRRGMSPMRFVLERRLAAAHRRLKTSRPDADITSIAIGLGFTHLGRFSVAYREAFGESPSHTRQAGPLDRRSERRPGRAAR